LIHSFTQTDEPTSLIGGPIVASRRVTKDALQRTIDSMSGFPIVVPEGAPPSVRVASARAEDVAARAPPVPASTMTTRGKETTEPTTTEPMTTGDGEEEPFKRKRGAFAKDLAYMMYGFGDAKEPDPRTIELMEDMLVEYLTNVAHRSMEVAERRGRMQTEDLLYVIRNDRKKFARVDELLEMNAKLKEARRNFDLHDPAAVLAAEREQAARERERDAAATETETENQS